MKRTQSVLTLLMLAGCGGSSPSAPTPVTPSAPTTYMITGTLSTTNGGTPVDGAIITSGGIKATTAGGAFTLTLPTTMRGTLLFTLDGAGLVPRRTYVRGGSARAVDLDAIADGNGFNLTFYRELVRNTFDAPTTTEPLRRWTRTPNVYLKTVDEGGRPISGRTLDLIEATIRDAVPRWTSGALSAPTIERGTEPRVGVSGWVTVRFPVTTDATICGRSEVAADGGWMELHYNARGCRCGSVLAPGLIRHEIGHVLGFWHTDAPSDVMYPGQLSSCDVQPSARERYHAAIAYKRPVGNADPDTDPAGAVNLAPRYVQ
jgi:hypothetical protein